MSEVQVLYTCIVCGRAWPSKQSLRAHFKVHKKEGVTRTTIFVFRDRWAEFAALCKKHKTTTCQLLDKLIMATVEGERQGIVTLATQNPTVIQVNHVVLGAPRGRYSHFDGRPFIDKLTDPALQRWPPNCDHVDKFFPWKDGKEIGCLDRREIVSLKACWICWYQKREVVQP